MEEEFSMSKKYPACPKAEADAHCWVFKDKSTFEEYYCKFPTIKGDEVRAKVLHTGLCLSDSKTGREAWGPCNNPCCPGHEVIAKISALGPDVKNRKIGEIVGIGPFRNCCENCEQCKRGSTNLCTGIDFSESGLYTKYFGGYSTLIQIRENFTFLVPDSIDITTAPPLLCAGITVYQPLVKHTDNKGGQKIGVLGIGGLGHLAVQIAAAMGHEVTAFTRQPSKVEGIKKLGAKHVIVVDEKFEAFKPIARQLHAIVNTIPVADKASFNAYLGLLRPEGKLLQVGAPAVNTPLSMDFFPLIFGELQVIGSIVGSCKDTQAMLDFCGKHKIEVQAEKYSWEDFPKALDKLENGKPHFRCVVNVEEYAKKNGL